MAWLMWTALPPDLGQLAAFVGAVVAASVALFKVMVWAVDGHRAIKAVPKLAHRVYLLERVLSEIVGEGRLPEWDLTELLEETPISLPRHYRSRLPPAPPSE